MNAVSGSVLVGRAVRKVFVNGAEKTIALDGIDIDVRAGSLTALVGPDGAGKTTMLRLAAGLLTRDSGQLQVLGIDPSEQPQAIQDRIGYMPQRFGLYEDLTVQENLDLYAALRGVEPRDRAERYARLLHIMSLSKFTGRLAGRLSGGMKQKLGLACTLVRSPDLLLLDEPTVGVDPLSRRELWDIIQQLIRAENLTVLMSTSYLDEAERCQQVLVLHQGRVLAHGTPRDIARLAADRTVLLASPVRPVQARLIDAEFPSQRVTAVEPSFEDGFMTLLDGVVQAVPDEVAAIAQASVPAAWGLAVEVRHLVRKFGAFTAVDHISFDVKRGEIFGLLGPNGAGKTTTFRMLCGLLPATGGELRVAGADLRTMRAEARQRIGYMAQKFSLYGALSVIENLEFFAGAYGLKGDHKRRRIAWALEQFGLSAQRNIPSAKLAGGNKQRLAMGAALLHEPHILFLDEPTSGADPLARRAFWRQITAFAAQGVTVIVTTHFMQEAEYCDRVVIMDAGKVLARGTPTQIREQAHGGIDCASMEGAFIAIVETARRAAA